MEWLGLGVEGGRRGGVVRLGMDGRAGEGVVEWSSWGGGRKGGRINPKDSNDPSKSQECPDASCLKDLSHGKKEI